MELVPRLTASRDDIVVDDVQFSARLLGGGTWWVRWRSVRDPSRTSRMALEPGVQSGRAEHDGEAFSFIVDWCRDGCQERAEVLGSVVMTPAAVLELAEVRVPKPRGY